MPETRVVLNPKAGRGYAASQAPLIEQELSHLGLDFDMVATSRRGEAIDLAGQAVVDGCRCVVAAGGDGTAHEVINGMMAANGTGAGALLGCIAVGSGNDFAVMNGVPTDVRAACRLLAERPVRRIDVGHVTLDGVVRRYFDNTVGIGFDGIVTREALKNRRQRGLALYLPIVLKTILFSFQPPQVHVTLDGNEQDLTVLMLTICNGVREGGGFNLAPQARSDDGYLDVLIARTLSKLGMLALVPRFMNGTHLGHKAISLQQASHVTVTSSEALDVHVDGEMLAEAVHRVEANVVPGCMAMISRGQYAA